MYLDVMGDVLLGQPQNPGVLVDLYHALGLPAALVAWLSYRPLFLVLFTALIITPLSMQRDIASLRYRREDRASFLLRQGKCFTLKLRCVNVCPPPNCPWVRSLIRARRYEGCAEWKSSALVRSA